MKPIAVMICLLVVAVVGAVFGSPTLLLVAVIPLAGAVYFAYSLGTRRSLLVGEDEIPRDIYQVVAIINRDVEQIAILRDSKRKRFAVASLGPSYFTHFAIKGEGDEKFFVPRALCTKATTTAETSALVAA